MKNVVSLTHELLLKLLILKLCRETQSERCCQKRQSREATNSCVNQTEFSHIRELLLKHFFLLPQKNKTKCKSRN